MNEQTWLRGVFVPFMLIMANMYYPTGTHFYSMRNTFATWYQEVCHSLRPETVFIDSPAPPVSLLFGYEGFRSQHKNLLREGRLT